MWKHILTIIIASVILAITKYPFSLGLHALVDLHQFILHFISHIFSSTHIGHILAETLALSILPFLFSLACYLIGKIFKRNSNTWAYRCMWVIFLILSTMQIWLNR